MTKALGFAGLVVFVACQSPTAADPPLDAGLVAQGKAAFAESSAKCHASLDGTDLAYFGYADSTIVRRAIRHVGRPTGEAIATYIKSLHGAAVGPDHRLFQPGDGTVSTDGAYWKAITGAARSRLGEFLDGAEAELL